MATLEEFKVEATSEVEASKPLYKGTSSGLIEFTDEEYTQLINDKAAAKLDEQDNGYKVARLEEYPSIPDQLDMQYHDAVNGTTTWQDAIAQVKSDNPKPS